MQEAKFRSLDPLKLSKDFSVNSQYNDNLNLSHPKQSYSYHLKGVVIHSGTADAGHYYSYIKSKYKGKE